MRLDDGCNLPDHNIVVGIMVAGIAIGALIGIFVAWLIYRKMQRTNNQLIEQINQVINED
jgi:high-affinity Fe2+/Pb2+ permease